MKITIRHTQACPNLAKAEERVRAALSAVGAEADVRTEQVADPEEAERLGFHGSPAILVDGLEILTAPGAPVAFACRVYETPEGPDGAPSVSQIVSALGR